MEEDILKEHYQFPDSDELKLQRGLSQINGAGMGLFTKEEFSKGEVLAQYYGSILTPDNSQNLTYKEEDKLLQISNKFCLIGRCIATKANDIVKIEPSEVVRSKMEDCKQRREFPRLPGLNYNARLSKESPQKIFIKALREIKKGEEVFVDYGFEYWQSFYECLYESD